MRLSVVLLIHVNVVNICAVSINSCNSGSKCSRTWTKSVLDEKLHAEICECQKPYDSSSSYGVSCSGSDLSNGPLVILRMGFCMTCDKESNLTFMGRCPYNHINYINDTDTYLPLEARDLMCNTPRRQNFVCAGQQRREGLLCSKCQSGLGPAVGSYTHQCVDCYWYGPLLYIAYVFVPATIFCVLIILLRINLLSPPINALVLLCHVIVSLVNTYPYRLIYFIVLCNATPLHDVHPSSCNNLRLFKYGFLFLCASTILSQ